MAKTKIRWNYLFLIVFLVYVFKCLIPFDKETKLSLGYQKDSLFNFTELAARYGYKSEEHIVITEDGYILTVFQVVQSKNCRGNIRRTPILLMHGLLESSDLFLDAGPKDGLAYLISDACYDIWVGNQRGNYYGRRHISLDPDKGGEFWDFTAEEMGHYDLPAMYDYILNYTRSNKLNYIGYSQGGSVFFIMCIERPEYCSKTRLMIALAPAVYLPNTESIPLRLTFPAVNKFRVILETLGVNELFSKGGALQELFLFMCQFPELPVLDVLCSTGGALFDSYHPDSISYKTQKTLYGHFPAGSSVKNFARYGQLINTGKFQKYDYGKTLNLEKYGREQPPEYNLGSVNVPVLIIHGNNDKMTTGKDLMKTENELPYLINSVTVVDPLWNHFDIVYSRFANKIVFPLVNKYLDEYSNVTSISWLPVT